MELRRFHELFLASLKGPLADLLDLRTEALTSYSLDQTPLQDSFRYRAKRLGLKIANLIVDETGELKIEVLQRLNGLFSQSSFILGPEREGDALIYQHIKKSLKDLAEKKEIWAWIRKFSPPLCHKKAEEIVRETLWPERIRVIQTVHVRKAVVASWLTLLRQTTGSCFATAPAILIQQTDPIKFLKDIYDLLSTGQMKRALAGKQYSVPLNLNSGGSDLQKIVTGFENSAGLAIALDAVQTKLSREVVEKVRELGSLTAEKYLRAVLLETAGLTEEDIRDEEHLARIQMTPLLAKQSAVYYQKPSERAQKVSEWKKKVAAACLSFRAITECALLRSWEYSIASFSDVKTEFARWNLYIGLGLHPDQIDGIGAFLYGKINDLLQKCRLEIDRLSREYEQEASAIRALEVMIQGAGSEIRINQLKGELISHSLSINSLIEIRNELIARADALVGFFASLIEQYDQKLQESFQELFDPSLAEVEAHLYEDSSAGFRLVYKHGRLDASQWTPIYNGEEYVNSLIEFFSNVEQDLLFPAQLGRELVSEITTSLILYIQDPKFLASAIQRAKEKGRKSPWDYTSGGTLQTLLAAYCNRDRPFTESSIAPRSGEDLLNFFIHFKAKGSLLMHSPTHAFIFQPQLISNSGLGKKADPWDLPRQEYLVHRISEKLPQEEKALFIHLFRQKNKAEKNVEFRRHLLDSMGPRIKQKEAIVDSVFYEQYPLFTQAEAKDALNRILRSLGISESVRQLEGAFFGSFDLYQLAKMIVLKSLQSAVVSEDWDQKIIESMRRSGFCSNTILFADTNWAGWLFGFVLNPVTGNIELWRLNRNATQGFPMVDWKQWLDAKNTSFWILLTESSEYL